jgi:hypothetical protein
MNEGKQWPNKLNGLSPPNKRLSATDVRSARAREKFPGTGRPLRLITAHPWWVLGLAHFSFLGFLFFLTFFCCFYILYLFYFRFIFPFFSNPKNFKIDKSSKLNIIQI